MGGTKQGKRLALDANLLIDRANSKNFAVDFFDVASEAGYSLFSPPTVNEELDWNIENADEKVAELSYVALTSMLSWPVTPFEIERIEQNYSHNLSAKLRYKGWIPENECNDGLIVAECGIKGIPILVTSDHHLLEIPEGNLIDCLVECGISPVHVMSPQQFLKVFR